MWSGRHLDKDQLRTEVWTRLQSEKIARRNPFGHIPDFIGAEHAAANLATLPLWKAAQVVKCNPDRPQTAVRLRALQAGKTLYMAVPQLTNQRCFVALDPVKLTQQGIPLETMATMKHALSYGRFVTFEEMQPIDLVVVGCVAVTRNGGRTGKGAGFADLELAMLKAFGLLKPTLAIATTVHSLQIVDTAHLPMQAHDWPLDWIATPETAIATQPPYPHPPGLDWAAIQPEQYQTIPILQTLKQQFSGDQES